MASGESEKTTIATDRDGWDTVQQFIEENILDEQRVEPYKGYKKYEQWADRWIPRVGISMIVLMLFVVAIQLQYLGRVSDTLMQPVSYGTSFIFGGVFLLGAVASVAQWTSEITAEQIAYHELASAFRDYRRDN